VGIHPFWLLFGGWGEGGVLEINFAFENGKLERINRGYLEWRK
jgi:hypothetical protein